MFFIRINASSLSLDCIEYLYSYLSLFLFPDMTAVMLEGVIIHPQSGLNFMIFNLRLF